MNVVGLFVNARANDIEQVLAAVPLNVIQFHGDESEQACKAYGRPYIKALRMKDGLDIAARVSEYESASGFLLDTYVKGEPGGTGQAFNWDRVPHNAAKPIVVAGGLTPGNVEQAVRTASPYAVDVSGGVESAPGIKSHEKINAFIRKAKGDSHK